MLYLAHMTMTKIKVKNVADLPEPQYETDGSAGMDFRAAIEEDVVIQPHERAVIPTGICVALPLGYELQIRGRSGLAARHGIGLVNGIGTIDSDFRGEIHVILINHGRQAFTIKRGDRIAQGVFAKYEQIQWDVVESLEATKRGDGKFGSTGRK
jgi:dUTP pyrophosphatase